jgi:hypothetical protein
MIHVISNISNQTIRKRYTEKSGHRYEELKKVSVPYSG